MAQFFDSIDFILTMNKRMELVAETSADSSSTNSSKFVVLIVATNKYVAFNFRFEKIFMLIFLGLTTSTLVCAEDLQER